MSNWAYVTIIDEIADLENLQWLNISSGRNFELPSLEKLQKLKSLYIQNTRTYERDIWCDLRAKNLEVLDISISDFHNIDGLDELQNLNFIKYILPLF